MASNERANPAISAGTNFLNVFLVVAALYGAGRLALESLREREAEGGGIALGHAVSVVTVVFAIVILAVQWPR